MGNLRKARRKLQVSQGLRPAQILDRFKAHNNPERGNYNAYQCQDCGTKTLTVHKDEGRTPMYLVCRAEGCSGTSVSMGYPAGEVPRDLLPAKWEWYRPDEEELKDVSDEMRNYVAQGGLALREI